MQVRLYQDDLRSCLADWDNVLAAIAERPTENVLETLFKRQISKSVSHREQMSYYERLDVGHSDRSNNFLISIARKRLEQQRRDRTRDDLHNSLLRKGKALVSADRDVSGRGQTPTRPKGVCRTWHSKGSCSTGYSCSYSHKKAWAKDGVALPRRGARKRTTALEVVLLHVLQRYVPTTTRGSARGRQVRPQAPWRMYILGKGRHVQIRR